MKFLNFVFLTGLICTINSGFAVAQQAGVKDSDGDGVADAQDKCLNMKGVARYQGCPVPDGDKDRIDDETDKCPTIKGVASNEGCPEIKKPDLAAVKLAADAIVFSAGSSSVPKRSFVLLDKVAKILVKNPAYRLVVSVQIDNAEDKAKAEFLCQNRADSIAAYLEGKGVLDRQLFVRMFGTNRHKADSKPLESTSKAMVALKLLGY